MRIFALLLMLNLSLSLLSAQEAARYKIGINSNWEFVKGEKPSDEEANWEAVNLPHSWNIDDPFDEEKGYYQGVGWYRKVLNTDVLPQKEKAFLYFEAANQYAQVYINGKKVGEHKGGYTAFCFDISNYLQKGDNLLEVQLDNSDDPAVPPLKGDFNFYGGIYRDVYLILTNAVHFEMLDHASSGIYITTPVVDAAEAVISIRGSLQNEGAQAGTYSVKAEIYNQNGERVVQYGRYIELKAGANNLDWTFSFPKPELWSPDKPNLYKVIIQLMNEANKQVLDELVQPLAFRTFKFDPDEGFYLNGKPLKLIGVNRHQDLPGKANALSNAEHLRDMELIKSMGANFFRTAHYPQDPTILQACDRLGLIVTMEIPLDHEITDSPEFYENCKIMMREMIRQYHNHPSIVIWAYMNEMFLGRNLERDRPWIDKIVAFAKELEQLTRSEDSTRYTMIPNHGDFKVYHESGMTQIPMIVGWNLYYGWYEEGFEGFGAFIDHAHEMLPDKPLIVTEYGAGADPRLRSFEPVRFDFAVEWETDFHQSHLEQITERPYLSGATVWNMFDFGSTNRQDAVPHVNNKGLCGFDRQPKDAFHLYQAWLSDQPFLKIAQGAWTSRIGIQKDSNQPYTQTVRAFGNVVQAELFHNGKSLGAKQLTQYNATWEVPFVDGENRLELRSTENGISIKDVQTIDFVLYPEVSLKDQDHICLNLGTDLYFIDEDGQQLWVPEKESKNKSWGYVGGQRFLSRDRGVGTDRDILGTPKDPLFQTQRTGVEQVVFPLKPGTYRLNLHFAELERKNAGERVFALKANGVLLHPGLDIAKEAGQFRATTLEYIIQLDEPLLSLDFLPQNGEAVINAIQIQKVSY